MHGMGSMDLFWVFNIERQGQFMLWKGGHGRGRYEEAPAGVWVAGDTVIWVGSGGKRDGLAQCLGTTERVSL